MCYYKVKYMPQMLLGLSRNQDSVQMPIHGINTLGKIVGGKLVEPNLGREKDK